jgi:hypothetical protein
LIMLFFAFLLGKNRNHFGLGLIVGLCVWVRPDGAALLIPLLITIVPDTPSVRAGFKNLLLSGLGFVLLAAPYLLFNLALSGTILPNTYYAKQTEYADLLLVPLYQRFFAQTLQLVTGVGFIILPAALYWLYRAIRNKDYASLSCFVWLILFTGTYAMRLPVTYQHGRYAMPMIPIFLLLGSLAGAAWFADTTQGKLKKLLQTAWLLSTGLICAAFFFIGAWTYANDVAYIESNMVNTAQWISANLPKNELIAAHDIGALGYFGSHQLIDLAGLISPDVIPFIRDQGKLAAYMDKNNVNYLVTFPNWYPELIKGKNEVFSSNSIFAKSYGGENMNVYSWK